MHFTHTDTYVCTYMRHCVVFVHSVNFSSSETEWVSLPYWLLFCFFVLFLHFNLLQIIPWHFPFFCMRLYERMFIMLLLLVLLLPFSFFIKMHNAHETSAQIQWVTATTATLRNCKLCVCTYGKRERESDRGETQAREYLSSAYTSLRSCSISYVLVVIWRHTRNN